MQTIPRMVLTRLGGGILVLLGGATLAFVVLQLLPGDPVDILLGSDPNASAEVRASIRAEYGLDQPVLVQYGELIARLVRLDFGYSYQLYQPVAQVIGSELMPTLHLAVATGVVAVVGAVAFSTLTAGRPRAVRVLATITELVSVSTPSFWVGLLLLAAFSFNLRWFPITGDLGFAALVLPVITLALGLVGMLSQVMRGRMEGALEEPFITTALARGATRTQVMFRHALRHSLVAATTLVGQFLGHLLGGAIIVEAVFGRPGLGRLTLQAVNGKDMPVIIGVVIVVAAAYVIVNLVADLLYFIIDPRLRTEVHQ